MDRRDFELQELGPHQASLAEHSVCPSCEASALEEAERSELGQILQCNDCGTVFLKLTELGPSAPTRP